MSSAKQIVSVLFVLQIIFVIVCPNNLHSLKNRISRQIEEDDDLTRFVKNLENVRVDLPLEDVRVKPIRKEARQDDDDDETTPRPEIPAIIPGVTQIFNGLLTGNINHILKGAFSFAPRNVSYGINTVYNSVVGLPPPVSTVPPTSATQKATVAPPTAAETDEDEDNDANSISRNYQRIIDY